MGDLAKEITEKIKVAKMKKRAKVLRTLPRSKLEEMCDPERRPWLADKETLVSRIIAQWSEADEEEVVEYIRNMVT